MDADAIHTIWIENFVRVWGAFSLMEEKGYPEERLTEIEMTIEKLVTDMFKEGD